MKRNWISIRRRTISLIAISALLLLQGCASSTGNGGSSASFEEEKANADRYEPLADNWKMLLKNSDLSDFERDVLERAVKNGKITQDDYEQAQSKYLECMVSEGYDKLKFNKRPDGIYQLAEDSEVDSGYGDAVVKCSEGTTMRIEALYRDQQDNPERYKDHSIIAVQCLRDSGIVDSSYTAAQFTKALRKTSDGSDFQNYSKVFGFPVNSDDSQTMYCLSLGGLNLGGEF